MSRSSLILGNMKIMNGTYLTIKELTDRVGEGITPRMVRHYHQVGLLALPPRSAANYRLYTQQDVQQLQRIVALKQQGFQLSHIQQLLRSDSEFDAEPTLMAQLQLQYHSVMQRLGQLRQTAAALESVLGRDRQCQTIQAAALAQLRRLEVETQGGLGTLERLWDRLDAETTTHPEAFQESLQWLLPDLADRSEIEADLLAKLVLACGDVSLVQFVRLSPGAIAAARNALKAKCPVMCDVRMVAAALDHPRLDHLGCPVQTLITDPHITSAPEAEQSFWQDQTWPIQLPQLAAGSILLVGYAPSVLMTACTLIEQAQIQPALVPPPLNAG
jgi:precorrin-8X/cobalt-precorrin-8 methylmutase